MVFSSIVFLYVFFPLFFICYFLAARQYKNAVIVLGSVLFYAYSAPRFVLVLLFVTMMDFFVVRSISTAPTRRKKTVWLLLSLTMNLGLLFYFKYAGFAIHNINHLSSLLGCKPIVLTDIVLPIGISFYTFETITYVVDVYRGVHQPLKRFWDYQLYIFLFPKLLAGPIIKFHDFAGQLGDHIDHETIENKLRGLFRFFIGLGKKVLIANTLGTKADLIFKIPHEQLGSAMAWVGAVSYALQIYFDFSGYSDMAIGMGRMMGFRFPENFNNPYSAVSITDFWRRWHITLGAWMREYLYIPLGGNRVRTKARLLFNIWLVFLLSGLWHGAAWGFVIWGAYHGLFLMMERLFLGKWLKKLGVFACIYTFFVVTIGWVFFKLEHFTPSINYLKRMFIIHPTDMVWVPDNEFNFIFLVAIFFSFVTTTRWGKKLHDLTFETDFRLRYYFVFGILSILICVVATGRITVSTFNPFIYYRF